MISSLLESLIRNIGGSLGRKIRYYYYKRQLGACGKNVVIDENVFFENPKYIHLGNNVWIDKQAILIAGPLKGRKNIKNRQDFEFEGTPGYIKIGNNTHIGIQTIIQGHGGVLIKDFFTSSSGCKIYSFSNDPYHSRKGTVGPDGELHYITSPVQIEENVWLGLNSSIIGGWIKKDSFILPNSVITKPMEENIVIRGFPAKAHTKRFS